jgi:hypothetical protein
MEDVKRSQTFEVSQGGCGGPSFIGQSSKLAQKMKLGGF